MSENSNLGDLTLRQLLQLYKTQPSSKGGQEFKGRTPSVNQKDIDKFSSLTSDKSADTFVEKKIDQNLAHIVDDLIKKIS